MELAERGVRLPNGLWTRELRHRDGHGAQTVILTTNFHRRWRRWRRGRARGGGGGTCWYTGAHPTPSPPGAGRRRAVGCHTTPGGNAVWRTLERPRRSLAAPRQRKRVEFGNLNLTAPIEPEKVEALCGEFTQPQTDFRPLHSGWCSR